MHIPTEVCASFIGTTTETVVQSRAFTRTATKRGLSLLETAIFSTLIFNSTTQSSECVLCVFDSRYSDLVYPQTRQRNYTPMNSFEAFSSSSGHANADAAGGGGGGGDDHGMEKGESSTSSQLPFIRSQDLPETGHEWVSLTPSVQFLPAHKAVAAARDPMVHGVSLPRKPLGSKRSHLQNQRHGDNPNDAAGKQQPQSLDRSRDDPSELGLLTATQFRQRLLDEEQQQAAVYREDNAQYRVQPFVEGVSDYDTYQQAWRMLGFMIDCDDPNQTNTNDDHHSGSNDENETGQGCRRYVLWAAVR
jgi:hypothetical protein